ncbi:MAG: hypothetical protein ABJL44_04995 [Algibacter sp.]
MYKKYKYLIFIIVIISSSLYAQQRTLVFNNEGKIIKNYGYDSHPKIENNIKFLIENPKKDCTYYLLYEWRNEYRYSANIIENEKLYVKPFTYNSLSISEPSDIGTPDERYMSFVLLMANSKGSEALIKKTSIENGIQVITYKDDITLNKILKAENIDLSTHISNDNNKKLFSHWNDLKKSEKDKKAKDQEILKLNKETEKLEKKIELIKLALDKLVMIDEAEETPNKIIELHTKLETFELELIDKKSRKTKPEKEQKELESKIQTAKNQITKILNKVQQNSLSYYNLLHQGVLISKNKDVKEIVYDVNKGKLFDSEKELLQVARLTPNLPQLTTDSELYCHIINLKHDDLEKNPFIISMEAELSEPVEIESPSNIRALEPVDIGSEVLNNKNIPSDSTPPDPTVEFNKDLKEYFPKSNYTPVAYSEYILKYPRPFEAKVKPTIKLLSNQFKTENFVQKVDKGTIEKASYDIKYETVTLIEDELPPVHRLFRFSVNAGVLLTNSVSYNYEQVPLANSSVSDLKEVKETSLGFRPSITFSTYLCKQDLAVNVPLKRFYESTHIDISIDYDDGDILDNIYLGVGFEPLRNIQLAVGARFGQVDRLKPRNFDPLLPISDQKFSSELNVGYYISLSLGFDLIPKFYNLIK